MSLWHIAFRNVWQNRRRYVAYLASSTFAVMIYFLYTALIRHPDLQRGYTGAGYVVQGMQAASIVIAFFTFFFLLYSNSAFVRSRLKEFGLLTLFGVSRGQLVAIIIFESLCIGMVAMAAGLGLGLLFLKLFFMAIAALLRLPQPLAWQAGPAVWMQTVLVFGSMFLAVSLASTWKVVRSNILELVRAGRQPKAAPTFSRWKAVLGLVLVLGGYAWASLPVPLAIILGIVPVTAMVSLGTALLMREGSIALLAWLHRRERFFYRPGPFLNISQLVYKVQENYRVLSQVALLAAVIITAVGTATTLYVLVTSETAGRYPHAVQLVSPGGGEAAKVDDALRQNGVVALTAKQQPIFTAQLEQRKDAVTVVPYSFYRAVARPDAETLPLSGNDDAILVSPFFAPKTYRRPVGPIPDRLLVEGESVPIQWLSDQGGRVLNLGPQPDFTLVLSDAQFEALLQRAPAQARLQVETWTGKGWNSRAMQRAAADLRTAYPGGEASALTTRVEPFQETMGTMGFILFVAVFVSLVFFGACFSLLYFRLFTEIDEDRRYFRKLRQVGASLRELKGLALGQAAVIFFAPFLAGLVHATFAMKALGTLTGKTVLQYGWAVGAIYLLLYALFFGATCGSYWRSLKVGLGGAGRLAE